MSGLVTVTGASGFIGHHLVADLVRRGHRVRGVDRVPPRYTDAAHETVVADLRDPGAVREALAGSSEIYALAADMGGMGYIASHGARILHDNLLIDAHTLEAARCVGADRLLYASSACVYPDHRQAGDDSAPLAEDEAFPAAPQDAYGWEKLTGEQLCRAYAEEHGLATRVVRLHNVYGPQGAWEGGREKAPAALCRKVAEAKLAGRREVELWGDGRQRRTFCWIGDAIEGLERLMASDCPRPVNLGSTESITLSELAHLVARVARWEIELEAVPGPQGVRSRCPDNRRLRAELGWEPTTRLAEGLVPTYEWIERQVSRRPAAAATG